MPLPPSDGISLYFLVPQCAQEMCVGWVTTDHTGMTSYSLQLRPRGENLGADGLYGSLVWQVQNLDGSQANGTEGVVLEGNAGFPGSYGALVVFAAIAIPDSESKNGQAAVMRQYVPSGWSAAGSIVQWNLIASGNFFAIQNCANTSQNLNVAGSGPYPVGTPILVWDWGGGAPNELWTLVSPYDSDSAR